jgi:hypothetical protein
LRGLRIESLQLLKAFTVILKVNLLKALSLEIIEALKLKIVKLTYSVMFSAVVSKVTITPFFNLSFVH